MSEVDFPDVKKVLVASMATSPNHNNDVITTTTDVIGDICIDANTITQQPNIRNRQSTVDPTTDIPTNEPIPTNNVNVSMHSLSISTDDPLKNPFTASGKLSRKADYILSHSTITRTELRISDPDLPKNPEQPPPPSTPPSVIVDETVIEPEKVELIEKIEKNVVNGYASSPVQVEVAQALLDAPQKGTAEQVKLTRTKKCCACCEKCCGKCCACCKNCCGKYCSCCGKCCPCCKTCCAVQ